MKHKYKIIMPALLASNVVLTIFGMVPAQAQTGNLNSSTIPVHEPSPIPYSGPEGSIKRLLCTPSAVEDKQTNAVGGIGGGYGASATKNPAGADLYNCINKLYRFGAAIGSFAAVFFVVLAGYLYIAGGESNKTKGKQYVINAIAGLVIIFTSFLLLKAINPTLLQFRSIQPPVVSAPALETCASLGLGNGCIIATANGSGGYSGPGNGSIIGIAEREVGNKGDGRNRGAAIEKYFSPGGSPGSPWCAYFASWVYGQAGIKTIGQLPGRGGTLTLSQYFKNNAGKKITEGTVVYLSREQVLGGATLYPGDLAFFDRGTEGDPNGHTAIVVAYDPTTHAISTIDGNLGQKDEVKRSTRDINKDCVGSGICKLIGVGRITP